MSSIIDKKSIIVAICIENRIQKPTMSLRGGTTKQPRRHALAVMYSDEVATLRSQ
jgi:hypothetical protein